MTPINNVYFRILQYNFYCARSNPEIINAGAYILKNLFEFKTSRGSN